jgi:hypothetical protein
MTITDLKGFLLVRQGNFTEQLKEQRQTVALMEADLLKARSLADTTFGALQATERDLADLEKVIAAATPATAPRAANAPETAAARGRQG